MPDYRLFATVTIEYIVSDADIEAEKARLEEVLRDADLGLDAEVEKVSVLKIRVLDEIGG